MADITQTKRGKRRKAPNLSESEKKRRKAHHNKRNANLFVVGVRSVVHDKTRAWLEIGSGSGDVLDRPNQSLSRVIVLGSNRKSIMANRGKSGTKLYVGNLPETCRMIDLQKLFQKYGTVVECDIVKDYGFVHFSTAEEAKAAQEGLDNVDFKGTQLKVEVSRSTVRQKPGMGRSGECIRCGQDGHWSRDCPKGPRPKGGDRYRSDPYRDPYDRWYPHDRYLPPPPPDRYRPYADPYERARPPPPRDPYYRDRELRDPYARPPPEYYGRSRSPPPPPPRDYYYYDRPSYRVPPTPPGTSRMSPVRPRVGPY